MIPNGMPSEQRTSDYSRPPDHSDPLLPPPFGQAERVNGVYVFFLLMLAAMAVVGSIVQYFFGFVLNAIVTEVTVVLLPILLLLRRKNPLRALRLDSVPRPAYILSGMAGVLGLAVILAEFGYWSDKIFPMPDLFKEAYLAAITPHSLPELFLFVFVAGLVPGICEEIAFRGYFQRVFDARHGSTGGILIGAGLFAVMHLDPWHMIALFAIGAYLGLLYHWTQSLWVPIAAHFANNAASVIMIYAMPDASVSQMSEAPSAQLLIAACAIFAAAIIWLRRNAKVANVEGAERAVHD